MRNTGKRTDGCTLLILEDEMSMNRGIAFAAERSGFEVVQCYTVAEAFEAISGGGIDVMTCDINLPDGSGLEFINRVRSLKDMRQPYIICLTVLDTETDHVLGYEAGADDYVVKPFSLSVLMLKLEAFARRFGKIGANTEDGAAADAESDSGLEPQSRSIVSGELTFLPDKHEARVSGSEVKLTRNECRLLLAFLRNPGQVLSKEQLLMQAFDTEESFVDENTLAVNIRRLREKLGDSAQNPVYIKNIRGLGYIWMKKVH